MTWVEGAPVEPGAYWVKLEQPSLVEVEVVEMVRPHPEDPLEVRVPGNDMILYLPDFPHLTHHMPIERPEP